MARQLIELGEARGAVLGACAALGSEPVALEDALGRTLAESVESCTDVPGFDNSAMDGFAVRAADTDLAGPGKSVRLRIVDESRAGQPAAARIGAGEAVRISTGALLPAEADGVVPLEEATEREGFLETESAVAPERYVRRAGADIRCGEAVLAAGTTIGPAELGVLASLGCEASTVVRRPRLSILVSGDELLGPGEPMRPGGVRDANSWTVPALARLAGAEVGAAERIGDDLDQTRKRLEAALDADVVVICGGVSVGDHDHVRSALESLGVEQRFWGVALRPGRPTWFGVHDDGPADGGSLAFGLPGNPVSAVVTFLLFVRPALRALGGADPDHDRTLATLDQDFEQERGRAQALRVRLSLAQDGWHARPTTAAQGSHILSSMLGADALAMIPAERERVRAGERVEVELLARGGAAL